MKDEASAIWAQAAMKTTDITKKFDRQNKITGGERGRKANFKQ